MIGTIGIIGAGNMGNAIIKGLLAGGELSDSSIRVSDNREGILAELKNQHPGIFTSRSNRDIVDVDILILAVKPQVYEEVIADIVPHLLKRTVIVTIAAGIPLAKAAKWLGEDRKIIRTMPNTPALVSVGMTALCPGPGITEQDIAAVRMVFEAIGHTVMMPENLMDTYTALAGSSPAWVFMLIESLVDGAVLEGIPHESAYKIAGQAVFGAAKLFLDSDLHPADLKDKVCSPGGTTIAGLAALEENGFRSSIIKAMKACILKGKELGSI